MTGPVSTAPAPRRSYRAILASALGLLVWGCEASNVAQTSRPDYSQGTHVVLLGTGTPNAEPDRSGTAVAIVVNGNVYLVDAGPGVVRQAAAAMFHLPRLSIVFITHLHSDHTVGLPDLMYTPWVLGRDRPLEVYGPPGIGAMTDHLLTAYQQDVQVRTAGLEPANAEGYKVDAREIEPGVVYQDDLVQVTALPVQHGSWPYAFGYRFDTADRSIVISGDAVPSDAVVAHCAGCDVLVHEVYSQTSFERRAPIWQQYHSGAHTSTVELAELARRAQPKLLVLYHQLLWGTTPDELLEEIRARWNGQVVYGRDLDVY
ncbi:MAG: MBL fold metallo-hydrolase [Gemmatimonadales bacterium]|nr:MBL fold metallo-hydrolase [Gemmatimonadales bacterium]NIN12455.1 MBL fold metallo-hydrolase [Gemmatimonadales bacterium]NIN50831.1 MBL fold metallo-hydrolase [Gemmatimonadales bacterium]NIP08295.1 MBL fold metallo-hydrolase [Gemmatimonadales bacterium]NIR00819.1 MBL fold metallo-hydrolase [Gemmatimonadales bacterium]